MRYLIQEHLVTPDNPIKRGSCYQTVIACLLDKEIHEVPNFYLAYWTEEERNNAHKVFLKRYCGGDRSTAEDYQKENYSNNLQMFLNHWPTVLDFWLAAQGYQEQFLPKEDYDEWLMNNLDRPYMVSGKSSRGVKHVVIYMNGQMIHDPHPSHEGLVELSEEPYSYLDKLV